MAESVVQLLLNELSGILKEELKLQRGVKQEIEKVKEELEAIKAFLKYADGKKEEDPRSKTWVEQVRDVSYEIEDVLDEFLFQVAKEGGPHNNCVHKICSTFRKWKAKHQIGSELQSIKGRVNDIAERPRKYGFPSSNLNESGSTSSLESNTKDIDRIRRSAALVEESQLVGLNAPKEKLVDWLTGKDNEPNNLKVLAIVGMGGLGKTTLAKQIYQQSVATSQFEKPAFTTVSQTLREDELLKDIIQQLFPEDLQLPTDRLKERMKERLQNERYLIILDDVWKIDHWDQIKLSFPRNDRGSRILITTRDKDVARYCSKEFQGMVHDLQPLSETDSWALFCKKTFSKQPCPSNLKPICQQILHKCGGVPLAILAIGGLLATKNVHHIEAWVMVQRSLSVELTENPRLQMMNKILGLSFDDLPHDLKPCYMYLGIFPEDYPMNWTTLIRLWISEGFVTQKGERTPEEVADSYLHDLLDRSLIQVHKMRRYMTGRVRFCRIHDFLREFVLSKSREQRFISSEEGMERVRRKAIHRYDEIKGSLLPRLRSLLFFMGNDVKKSSEMSKLPGDSFKLLNVIDLEGAPLDTFPEEISKLLLLKYLSLRRTKISKLPKSIGNLSRLETLDLKYTLVTKLPYEISILQKLRHLLICRCFRYWEPFAVPIKRKVVYDEYMLFYYELSGVKVRANIGGLLWLQELYYIEAPEDSEWINDLTKLSQLRKLGLVKLREQHWRQVCSCISNMTNLRSLVLQTDESFELEYMRSPPPFLQQLHLHGHLDELPNWVCSSSLQNLQVLKLMSTRLKKDPCASLGGFPNLIALVLWHAFEDNIYVEVPPGSFPALRTVPNNGETFHSEVGFTHFNLEAIPGRTRGF